MAGTVETGFFVLDPMGETDHAGAQLANRLPNFKGRTIGVLENHSGRSLDLTRLPELFAEQFPEARVLVWRKPFTSKEAPEAMLAEVAATCDAVIAATGQ
jgi:hypothetical protein